MLHVTLPLSVGKRHVSPEGRRFLFLSHLRGRGEIRLFRSGTGQNSCTSSILFQNLHAHYAETLNILPRGNKIEISCKVSFLLLCRASLNPPLPFVKAELMKTLRIKVGLDFMLIYVKNVAMES